jgi:hypothetical protein
MCRTLYDPETGYIHECFCSVAEKLEKDLEHARDHFIAVAEMLYGKVKWDKMKLEEHMDEISHSLDIKITDQCEIAI